MKNGLKSLALLGFPLGLVLYLWNTPFVFPFKILTVFFHESSHAIATIITGGEVKEMVVSAMVGGHVLSLGGNRFITLSAGYLGSLFWGALIYYMAAASHKDRQIIQGLGVVILLITIFYMSPIKAAFGYAFAIITGVVLIISGRKLPNSVNDFFLRFIGLCSMVYVPFDIVSDTIHRSYLRSDARMLAEEIGGTTIMWGSTWLVISLFVILITLYFSVKHEAQ